MNYDFCFILIQQFIFSAALTEDFCGVEPVTLPPIEKETRPPPEVDQDRLRQYDGVNSALLGCKFDYKVLK